VATVTGAPNFAFELCADRILPEQAHGLDLSTLKVMFCGAEPIRATALRAFETRFATAGFDPQSFYPCYGLAESTLLACNGRGPGRPRVLMADRQPLLQGHVRIARSQGADTATALVSCGKAAGTAEIVIANPVSRTSLAEGQIGEIWLPGPSIAFCSDAPPVLHRWCRKGAFESPPIELPSLPDELTEHDFESIRDRVRDWMVQWLIVRGGIESDQIDIFRCFEDYGLDSLMAIELVGDLEDAWDVELTPMVAMEHPTISQMATLVAKSHCGDRSETVTSLGSLESFSEP